MKAHDKIRLLRESKNWSQEDMAAKLNMSLNGYSKIERGETKAHIEKLEKIAEVLGTELIELLFGGGYISFNSNHCSGNIIGSSKELAFEIEKLNLMLAHKDAIIQQLEQQIAGLKEINALLKKGNG